MGGAETERSAWLPFLLIEGFSGNCLSKPVEMSNIVIANMVKPLPSPGFELTERVHRYSPRRRRYQSASSRPGEVAQSRDPNVPINAKLVLEAKYQNERKWFGPSRLTKSMAEMRRALAALRQMCWTYESTELDGEARDRMIRRWSVISAAKYARWRYPTLDSLLEEGLREEYELSKRISCGRPPYHSFNLS
ncbi:hypothetical protein HG530_015335 [Fusarium avenaceum]|nr:hypothetical protein HG530_015335 [Fusarium avenaceum]